MTRQPVEAWGDYPPQTLRQYALVADGRRGALIGQRGDVVWLCVPRWDSPAVLSSLVGGDGLCAISPVDPFVWGGYYEPGTLIWRSRWVTTRTVLECREALLYPGDEHRAVLLRRVEAVEDDVEVDVVVDVRGNFGGRSMRELQLEDGRWTARTGDLRVRWSGSPGAHVDEQGRIRDRLKVSAGSHHDFLLEVSDRPFVDTIRPDDAWVTTEAAWVDAVPDFADTVAPRDARHAYAVIRGMTRPGGGMVAAATLGLPERAEAGTNYDYRYVWLRDQAYAGLAAGVEEPHDLLLDAVAFTTARLLENGDDLSPAYGPDGSELPHETTLSLPGYPGGKDIVGNWVHGQFQLDTLGEILKLISAAARHDVLTSEDHRAIQVAVRLIEKRWQQPEAGIWELDDDWWTQSRLACVAGLTSIAEQLPRSEASPLAGLADTILAETSRRCLRRDGAWRRSPSHDGLDASLLLPPVRGGLPASDPRTRATLDRVTAELTEDGYVYRFAPDERPLGEAEGAFVLCGFVMSLAQWQQGDQVSAFRWFERNRAACGPPGLLSEEYDVRQRQLRGNLPQAFTHGMLLECAQRLAGPPR